ncbi:NDUFAF3/Mth938 domain-containing protein [Trinorchestia longiramus]|nr:NDUFAF3/Mth938 domain-containing protein [Trinorchestia longiramus]
MIIFKRSLIGHASFVKNNFLSSSRFSVYVSQLQSKYTEVSLLNTDHTDRGIRQILPRVPGSENLPLFTCHSNLSRAFYSTSLTQVDRNSTFLLGSLGHRENCAKFHSDEDRTYVTLLNREENNFLMVDSYSQHGFRMNNGLAVVGAIALFPKSILSWNVGSAESVTREALSLFYMIAPKIDLLVLGIGDPGSKFDISLMPFMRNKGISLEVLSTEKAVATYNFLTEEGRSVAGAFIPPSTLRPTAEDCADAIMKKRRLFETNIQDEIM